MPAAPAATVAAAGVGPVHFLCQPQSNMYGILLFLSIAMNELGRFIGVLLGRVDLVVSR